MTAEALRLRQVLHRVLTSRLWIGGYLLAAGLSGVLVWIVGHRGIFFFDQSAVFDGAWRLVQGQVIYRDFYVPFGPVVYLLQALFFLVFGVNFSSMVLSAAALNVAAVLLVMWIVRRILPDPDQRATSLAAGVLTAIWFQAPTGTLWFDQVGFFFNLAALALVLKGADDSRTAAYLHVAAGCCLVVAALSKQTAGVIFLPVPIGAVIIQSLPDLRKAFAVCRQIAAGMLLLSVVFAGWVWMSSSVSGFSTAVVTPAGALAADRFALIESVFDLVRFAKTWDAIWLPITLLGVSVILGAFSIRHGLLAVWLVLGYALLQNLFATITLNNVQNELGYLGLITALAFGLFYEVLWKRWLPDRRPLGSWAGVVVLTALAYFAVAVPARNGLSEVLRRTAMEFPSGTRFEERVRVRHASRLIWGEPTMVGTSRLARKDFEDLNTWLEQTDGNFFVFPDSTILYGLHRRQSPQPWVYLLPGHGFLESDLADVDKTIVNSLEANDVTVIVLERASHRGSHELLNRMSELSSWIRSRFEKAAEFGLYEVLVLRDGAPRG